MDVAIYYGSTYGDTADAAERIAAALGDLLGQEVPLHEAGWGDPRRLEEHEVLVVGCSTWDGGELQADWRAWYGGLSAVDLRGKVVALFGTGDQVAYADTYLDALGILAGKFEERGARLVGSWPAGDYEHDASRAQRGDAFVGLALDYVNQAERTEARIAGWTRRLANELPRPAEPAGALG